MICEKNDAANDYYAIRINDATDDWDDRASLYFDDEHDDEHDGTVVACPALVPPPEEDVVGVRGTVPGVFEDMHWCNAGWGGVPLVVDVAMHGSGRRTLAGDISEYEIQHPLSSGDSEDYSLSIGSTVGWCFVYWRGATGVVQYPASCHTVAGGVDRSTGQFGDIVKDPPAPPFPPVPVGGVLAPVNKLVILAPYLVLAGLVGAVVAVFAIRRTRKA